MSDDSRPDPEPDHWAPLVPELLVRDIAVSTAFFRDVLGFRVRFSRPEDGFVYLEMGGAHLMLEEIADGAWLTGPMDTPFGRGINLQIEVADVRALHDRIEAAGLPLFRPLRTEWYRQGDVEHGQSEFLVQDPDGYLLRFVQPLGERPAG